MTSLIFGLRHFRSYLLGRKFTCRVDHMALTYYQKTPDPIGQQARYLDLVAEFDFDLQYMPGSRYLNSDALSHRRPCEVDNGEPCKQCNRRVTAQHVRLVQTRAQQTAEATEPEWHDEIGKAGPKDTSPESERKQINNPQASGVPAAIQVNAVQECCSVRHPLQRLGRQNNGPQRTWLSSSVLTQISVQPLSGSLIILDQTGG